MARLETDPDFRPKGGDFFPAIASPGSKGAVTRRKRGRSARVGAVAVDSIVFVELDGQLHLPARPLFLRPGKRCVPPAPSGGVPGWGTSRGLGRDDVPEDGAGGNAGPCRAYRSILHPRSRLEHEVNVPQVAGIGTESLEVRHRCGRPGNGFRPPAHFRVGLGRGRPGNGFVRCRFSTSGSAGAGPENGFVPLFHDRLGNGFVRALFYDRLGLARIDQLAEGVRGVLGLLRAPFRARPVRRPPGLKPPDRPQAAFVGLIDGVRQTDPAGVASRQATMVSSPMSRSAISLT